MQYCQKRLVWVEFHVEWSRRLWCTISSSCWFRIHQITDYITDEFNMMVNVFTWEQRLTSDSVQALQRRIAAVSSWHPELSLPDVSTVAVLSVVGEWLPLYIGKSTTSAELRKINMEEVIWGMLTYEQQMSVDTLAPTHIVVPTGSRIRVDYHLHKTLPIFGSPPTSKCARNFSAAIPSTIGPTIPLRRRQ